MRRTLATIGAALAIGVPGVLVGASLAGPEQRTSTASHGGGLVIGVAKITINYSA